MLATANVTLKYGQLHIYADSSHHHLLLEHIYLTFWVFFTSNCHRLLNKFETCVLVSSPKDKNKSYNYYIALGKCPYTNQMWIHHCCQLTGETSPNYYYRPSTLSETTM